MRQREAASWQNVRFRFRIAEVAARVTRDSGGSPPAVACCLRTVTLLRPGENSCRLTNLPEAENLRHGHGHGHGHGIFSLATHPEGK